MKIKPRKTKQIQGKPLGFPWIPLAESGLFNELQRIQIKKIFSPVTLWLKDHKSRAPLLASSPPGLRPREGAASIRSNRKIFSTCSVFQQENVQESLAG